MRPRHVQRQYEWTRQAIRQYTQSHAPNKIEYDGEKINKVRNELKLRNEK